MKKAITPIIAVIILLLIALALGASGWVFLSGYAGTLIGKSFVIPLQGAACTDSGVLSVYITNTGQTDIVSDDDIDMCMLNGAECDVGMILPGTTVPPGKMVKVFSTTVGVSGTHKVQLGIGATTHTILVYCPGGSAGLCTQTDGDGDGYYYPGGGVCGDQDCDDDNPNINPGEIEVCNDVDDDCDGTTDSITQDCSITYQGICAVGTETCTTGAWSGCPSPQAEVCDDQIDNDCDGYCDDAGAICTDSTTPGDSDCTTGCTDADYDGYGSPASAECTYPDEDCDDNPAACGAACNPGITTETFCYDTFDNDCDGATDDEDSDCVPPAYCTSGVQDGDETGIDCGGSCPISCGTCRPNSAYDYYIELWYNQIITAYNLQDIFIDRKNNCGL